MKIIVTGGHLSPALAVIESLPKDAQVFFIGRKNSFEGDKSPTLEYQLVKSLNIPFINLPSARLQRNLTIYTVFSLLRLPYALARSVSILTKTKPDVVLGFGGYISLPVCFAAAVLGITVVIHEQTLQAGLANKIISLWAKKVCISWKTSESFFPKKKTILTGNPIRKKLLDNPKPETRNPKPVIYITGGSTGSHFINGLIGESLIPLLEKYVVIHQTGDSRKYKDFDRLLEFKKVLPKEIFENYNVEKFIETEKVSAVLNTAMLVVCRAGINIVTELISLKKPAILIPLPIAAGDEQMKNAQFLKDLGLAQIIKQDEISAGNFVEKVNEMIGNIDKYKLRTGGNLIEKNAAQNIILQVYEASKKK